MKWLVKRSFVTMLYTSSIFALSTQAMASAFQIWEQDAAGIGNNHAGYAAWVNDASTAYYNPAGIPHFKTQQVVLGVAAIIPDFKYQGSVIVIEDPVPAVNFGGVTAQGGTFNLVPNLHYVAPITDCIGFGLSIVVPFGLKTDYGRDTPIRYAATLTSISVIDISPALGFQLSDQASVGFGIDFQKVDGEFDNVGMLTANPTETDSPTTNKLSGTGYGYHLGFLYEFSPCTRIGLAYHSKVRHHLSGTSTLSGPLAIAINDDNPSLESRHASSNITIPPFTTLSFYTKVHPQVALMGSATLTQWNSIQNLTLNGFAGAEAAPPPDIAVASTNIVLSMPEHYRNTWNLTLGTDYYYNDCITLRAGVGYDQTPVRNYLRHVQLPDADRFSWSIGGHYQATKCLGFDIGWMHLLRGQANVNPPPQVTGAQTVITNGKVTGGGDVYGAQLTWNM